MAEAPLNALTFDVEDYFMVSAFDGAVPKSAWDGYESRVAANTGRILDLLRERGVKATFFFLGWVGERHPALVRRVREEGHEVACHGYWHRLVYDQTPAEFREDVRRAKRVLEDASGAPVTGYRAPSFSIVKETLWALPILREEGFLYDASFFPAPHARGGMQEAPRWPHRVDGLAEFPMSVLTLGSRAFGFSGGGYFRLFPYGLIRWGVRRCHREGLPAMVYLHPWELDPDQPRMKGRPADVFKHYVNLRQTEKKLRALLGDFRFSTARDVLKQQAGLVV